MMSATVFRKWLFEQWIEQKRSLRFCSMESDCELASVAVSRELARMLPERKPIQTVSSSGFVFIWAT